MKPHPLLACFIVTIAPACSTTSPMSSTPTTGVVPLLVTITPNPLARRAAGEQIVWNVAFQNGGSIGLRVDRSEAVVLDASGATVAERQDFWSRSAGCSACGGDLHLAGRTEATFSGLTASVLVTPGVGARFLFTTFYTDDSGTASSTRAEIAMN